MHYSEANGETVSCAGGRHNRLMNAMEKEGIGPYSPTDLAKIPAFCNIRTGCESCDNTYFHILNYTDILIQKLKTVPLHSCQISK